jgi:hypothetical protein
MTQPPKSADNAAEPRVHTSHKRRHHAHPFQFGVASLLWTIVLVAMGSAWHIDRFRLSRDLDARSKELEQVKQAATQELKRVRQAAASDRALLNALAMDAQVKLRQFKDERHREQQVERELFTLVRRQREAALLNGL